MKILSLILTMALSLALIIPSNAYFADYDGTREGEFSDSYSYEDMNTDGESTSEEDNLTFDEKVTINNDESDSRWFDITEDCEHPKTTPYLCYSPTEAFWQEECDICHLVLNEWQVEEEEEAACDEEIDEVCDNPDTDEEDDECQEDDESVEDEIIADESECIEE